MESLAGAAETACARHLMSPGFLVLESLVHLAVGTFANVGLEPLVLWRLARPSRTSELSGYSCYGQKGLVQAFTDSAGEATECNDPGEAA